MCTAALRLALAPPGSSADDASVVGFQLPRIDGHERLAASLGAHARTAQLAFETATYEPGSFDISQLPRRSRALVESSGVDDVVWVVHEPLPMRLYLYEGSTGAVWTRSLEPTQLDATATEVVSNVSIAIGMALRAGEIRDMARVDPDSLDPDPTPAPDPEPVPDPPPAPLPASLWPARHPGAVWIRLGYLGNTFSSAMPWHSALALRVTWKVRPSIELWARYAYVATQAISLGGVELDLRRHPVTLGAGARIPFAPRFDAAVGGAVTVDPVTRVVSTGGPPLQSADDGLRLHASTIAYAGIGVHVAPRVRMALDVAVDVLLTRADVVVRRGDAQVRHEPNRVRLATGVGIEIGLGGPRKKE